MKHDLAPVNFLYIKCPDADFDIVCLEIQVMYEYGVSFKSVRYLQEYDSFHFYSVLYALHFFTFDEKSWMHMYYAAMRPFFARSLWFLKICTLNT